MDFHIGLVFKSVCNADSLVKFLVSKKKKKEKVEKDDDTKKTFTTHPLLAFEDPEQTSMSTIAMIGSFFAVAWTVLSNMRNPISVDAPGVLSPKTIIMQIPFEDYSTPAKARSIPTKSAYWIFDFQVGKIQSGEYVEKLVFRNNPSINAVTNAHRMFVDKGSNRNLFEHAFYFVCREANSFERLKHFEFTNIRLEELRDKRIGNDPVSFEDEEASWSQFRQELRVATDRDLHTSKAKEKRSWFTIKTVFTTAAVTALACSAAYVGSRVFGTTNDGPIISQRDFPPVTSLDDTLNFEEESSIGNLEKAVRPALISMIAREFNITKDIRVEFFTPKKVLKKKGFAFKATSEGRHIDTDVALEQEGPGGKYLMHGRSLEKILDITTARDQFNDKQASLQEYFDNFPSKWSTNAIEYAFYSTKEKGKTITIDEVMQFLQKNSLISNQHDDKIRAIIETAIGQVKLTDTYTESAKTAKTLELLKSLKNEISKANENMKLVQGSLFKRLKLDEILTMWNDSSEKFQNDTDKELAKYNNTITDYRRDADKMEENIVKSGTSWSYELTHMVTNYWIPLLILSTTTGGVLGGLNIYCVNQIRHERRHILETGHIDMLLPKLTMAILLGHYLPMMYDRARTMLWTNLISNVDFRTLTDGAIAMRQSVVPGATFGAFAWAYEKVRFPGKDKLDWFLGFMFASAGMGKLGPVIYNIWPANASVGEILTATFKETPPDWIVFAVSAIVSYGIWDFGLTRIMQLFTRRASGVVSQRTGRSDERTSQLAIREDRSTERDAVREWALSDLYLHCFLGDKMRPFAAGRIRSLTDSANRDDDFEIFLHEDSEGKTFYKISTEEEHSRAFKSQIVDTDEFEKMVRGRLDESFFDAAYQMYAFAASAPKKIMRQILPKQDERLVKIAEDKLYAEMQKFQQTTGTFRFARNLYFDIMNISREDLRTDRDQIERNIDEQSDMLLKMIKTCIGEGGELNYFKQKIESKIGSLDDFYDAFVIAKILHFDVIRVVGTVIPNSGITLPGHVSTTSFLGLASEHTRNLHRGESDLLKPFVTKMEAPLDEMTRSTNTDPDLGNTVKTNKINEAIDRLAKLGIDVPTDKRSASAGNTPDSPFRNFIFEGTRPPAETAASLKSYKVATN